MPCHLPYDSKNDIKIASALLDFVCLVLVRKNKDNVILPALLKHKTVSSVFFSIFSSCTYSVDYVGFWFPPLPPCQLTLKLCLFVLSSLILLLFMVRGIPLKMKFKNAVEGHRRHHWSLKIKIMHALWLLKCQLQSCYESYDSRKRK